MPVCINFGEVTSLHSRMYEQAKKLITTEVTTRPGSFPGMSWRPFSLIKALLLMPAHRRKASIHTFLLNAGPRLASLFKRTTFGGVELARA